MSDPINPKHYKHLPAEAIDIIMAAIAKAPSNESAFLQGQVLKYLLRCWEKKGIEDLRKAKWYLDRMVNEFDDLLAEASGANETPDGGAQIPQGWRELKSDEVPSVGDKFLVGDAQYTLFSNWTVTYGCGRSDHVYIRKIELPNREELLNEIDGVWDEGSSSDTDQDDHPHDFKVGDAVISWHGQEGVIEAINLIDDFPITVRHSIREQVSYKLGGIKKKHDEPPPKRYREPTQADLKDGPIDCEVRDLEGEPWKAGFLSDIYNSASLRFEGKTKVGIQERWEQCRIEVT